MDSSQPTIAASVAAAGASVAATLKIATARVLVTRAATTTDADTTDAVGIPQATVHMWVSDVISAVSHFLCPRLGEEAETSRRDKVCPLGAENTEIKTKHLSMTI
jgi:hypothetical protein